MTKTTDPKTAAPWPFEAYTHIVRPLTEEEGGGFLLTIPDLPGLMADGETIEAAIQDGRLAFDAVIAALLEARREIPAPSFRNEDVLTPDVSGKFVTRVPKTIHARLAARARAEGVSLNTMVLTLLAEGLGRKPPRRRVNGVTGSDPSAPGSRLPVS
ncbi:MAG: type II toxin-antitoxin system HicB family antitoxin [Candidatus Accumulibacter sp.]|jgi:antitoxin HicB|nr:type II toxin-antitoxin system HicB family antitoxin [Accumulibacter sp.]